MVKLKFTQMFGGLQWGYSNAKGDTLSVICHNGSYGWDTGKFEIMASWKEDVKGNLTFGEVQRWINILEKREIIDEI